MTSGIASMTYSRPLRGSTSPKVDTIWRPSTPNCLLKRRRPCGSIGAPARLAPAPPHLGAIGARRVRLVDGDLPDPDGRIGRLHGLDEIPGEGGDPTAPGHRGRDENDPHMTIFLDHRSLDRQAR